MKTTILAAMLFLSVSLLQAQNSDSARYDNYFGFSASRISGLGLIFGWDTSPKITIQITGGIFKTNTSSSSSFGMEVQYNITNVTGYRLYVGPAIGTFNSTDNSGYTKTESSETVFGFGMGGAAPVTGIFNDRLRFTLSLYYPTFYKDGIGIGIGASMQFLF
jgi:hypothetical protein